MEYDDTNKLALWTNDKRQAQKHPHLSGQGHTTQEVWASAWFDDSIDEEDKKTLMDIVKRHRKENKTPFLRISLQNKKDSQASGVVF